MQVKKGWARDKWGCVDDDVDRSVPVGEIEMVLDSLTRF